MPPRIPLFQCLSSQTTAATSNASRSFCSTPAPTASTVAQRRRHRDPYALAQARARKAANLSRQEVLKKERAAALGDPVRGITTPFVRSFDTALPQHPAPQDARTNTPVATSPDAHSEGVQVGKDEHLNFYVSASELRQGLDNSRWLTTPSVAIDDVSSELTLEKQVAKREEERGTASEALRRIASLSLGSSKDRLRVNKQRCIDTFGRHSTDTTLPPKPLSVQAATGQQPQGVPRVGPDTGSSEVQIAILTAKIRTLAEFVETRGKTDRVNKRNLRLLVHRRQKLLKYLRRKERGGPRWQHVVETLGLTEGTWKGEITLGP